MKNLFKTELKNSLLLALLASTIFSIVFYLLFHFLVYLFLIKSSNYISSGVGAFMGAFAAFIFLIIERAFSKYRERRVKHFNALVKAEQILNENLQLNSDNIYMAEGFIKTLKQGKLHVGSFNQLIWDSGILLDLASLEIINKLNIYAIDIRKVNRDLNAVESWYEQIKLALVQKDIDPDVYKTNVDIFIEQLNVVRKFLLKLDKENEIRQSEVRVMMRERNFIDWFFDKISTHKLPKNFKKKVRKEQTVLKREKEESRIQTKKEIKAMK